MHIIHLYLQCVSQNPHLTLSHDSCNIYTHITSALSVHSRDDTSLGPNIVTNKP